MNDKTLIYIANLFLNQAMKIKILYYIYKCSKNRHKKTVSRTQFSYYAIRCNMLIIILITFIGTQINMVTINI